ncbi:methyltransferase domain-containing protein [Candidatus Thorarchaeota archaeon]|nr:MAG: methyltransferase domain-containing protein [Candidatus Thorarchaeota archaeon]
MRHKSIDYDSVSRIYDKVRPGDSEMVTNLLQSWNVSPGSLILDVGCGTANNTHLLSLATESDVIGLDLSSGMLVEAVAKFPEGNFVQSAAENIPFRNSIFDFVYMTEVIHHISDIPWAIREMYRVLRNGGRTCIVTQSHAQIEHRDTSRFFPETVQIDQDRYPHIPALQKMLKNAGFSGVTFRECTFSPVLLGNDYLATVEQKGFSMLHKISNDAFASGLEKLRNSLNRGAKPDYSAEYTFVWAVK